MDQNVNAMGMLDLMVHSGFCVKDHIIVKANQGAKNLLITEGMELAPLLVTGAEEYAAFRDGCLYLTLGLNGEVWGASVTRMGDFDVFLLEQEGDQRELQAMALAARELREPLTSVMTTADRLFPLTALRDDPATAEQVARLNRGLFQMLRVISNMSDAEWYSSPNAARYETVDLRSFFEEVFARAQELVCHTGLTLTFSNLEDSLPALADAGQLERAVLNILSNAIKFTPKGGIIDARLTYRGKKVWLIVQDSGQGIPQHLRSSVHSRYLRRAGIHDGQLGIGLGMVLIRSVAAAHGGTVLIDHPGTGGTRITMTLEIRQKSGSDLRSNVLRVDYAGEMNHGLIELSESLPHTLYEKEKL